MRKVSIGVQKREKDSVSHASSADSILISSGSTSPLAKPLHASSPTSKSPRQNLERKKSTTTIIGGNIEIMNIPTSSPSPTPSPDESRPNSNPNSRPNSGGTKTANQEKERYLNNDRSPRQEISFSSPLDNSNSVRSNRLSVGSRPLINRPLSHEKERPLPKETGPIFTDASSPLLPRDVTRPLSGGSVAQAGNVNVNNNITAEIRPPVKRNSSAPSSRVVKVPNENRLSPSSDLEKKQQLQLLQASYQQQQQTAQQLQQKKPTPPLSDQEKQLLLLQASHQKQQLEKQKQQVNLPQQTQQQLMSSFQESMKVLMRELMLSASEIMKLVKSNNSIDEHELRGMLRNYVGINKQLKEKANSPGLDIPVVAKEILSICSFATDFVEISKRYTLFFSLPLSSLLPPSLSPFLLTSRLF